MPADRPAERSLPRFLLVFALAYAGGVTAYVPLLSLLLPLKVGEMAGAGRFDLLTVVMIAGAVAASIGNILFGTLSDGAYRRRRSRRRWIGGGLAATLASYAGIALAVAPWELIAAVVLYQFAVNLLLAPLLATMADAVPDTHKGLAGGLLTPAQPLAAMIGAGVIGLAGVGEDARLALVGGCIALLVLPILAAGRPPIASDPVLASSARAARRGDLALLWTSRLSVQVADYTLFTYLLFYFAEIAPGERPSVLAGDVGRLTALVFLASVPVALLLGRASDRLDGRKPFLLIAAVASAAGILGMASAHEWRTAVVGYALFGVGSATFLVLQSAYAMQVLPSPRHRGRDLGLLNLANTLPALLGPGLAWSLGGRDGFAPVLVVLAMLTLLGGVLVLPVRSGR